MAGKIFGESGVQLKEKLDVILNEKNAFTDILAKIEEKTKVKRLYLVMGEQNILKLRIFRKYLNFNLF